MSIRRPGIILPGILMVLFLTLLSACSGPQGPQPTPAAPGVPTGQQGTSAEQSDLAALGVTAVVVRPHGSANLYQDLDSGTVTALIPAGTEMSPLEVRDLGRSPLPGVGGQDVGYAFRVNYNNQEGWVFGTQLHFRVAGRVELVPTPTPGQNAPTPTAVPTAVAGKTVPYFDTIGTRNEQSLQNVKVVYLYETPSFDAPVVGLLKPSRGLLFIMVGPQNTQSPVVTRFNAGYYEDTWFLVSAGTQQGWAHASVLEIR